METPTFQNYIKQLYNLENELILSRINPIEIKIVYNETVIPIRIYSFNTIQELKLAIYENEYFNKNPIAAPNNQLLFIKKDKFIDPIDFSWNIKGMLEDPFLITSGYDTFTTDEGEKKINEIDLYENILLETKLQSDTLYLYLFDDLYTNYKGAKPLSNNEFNGRFYPYFPHLNNTYIYPNEKELLNIENRLNLYIEKNKLYRRIQILLNKVEEGYALEQISFAGLRYIQYLFKKTKNFKNVETYFYEINVNEYLQYLRLIPVGITPISKIHLKDIENEIPSIYDTKFLKLWYEEKSPTPTRDYIMGKIALKSTILNLPYIYSTLRLLDDGTFDVIIEPPKGIRANLLRSYANLTDNELNNCKKPDEFKKLIFG